MNPILTIDQGNSHPHGGLFDGGVLRCVYSKNQLATLKRKDYFKAVVCQVGERNELIQRFKEDAFDLQRFKKKGFFLDMPVNYSSSLGDDRLYQAYYLFKKYLASKKAVMLIDSGTFTTVDVIDSRGFCGGYIFPGNQVFLDCYPKGYQLFRLDAENIPLSPLKLPQTTKEAMEESLKLHITSLYEKMMRQFPFVEYVMITGGSGLFVHSLLKNIHENENIQYTPHLIHHALYYIVEKEYGK